MRKIEYRKIGFILISALIINVFFCIPLYSQNMFMGDDLVFHLSRIDGVLSALQNHQFPLKIYPYKNYGFGYASPLFYCDLFMIFPAILYRIGLPLVVCYKVLIFTSCLIAILIALLVFGYISKNKYIGLFATVIWSFSTYHLVDVFSRNALGEIFSFCFLPLLILNIYLLIVEDRDNWIGIGLTFAGLLISHNITFAISCIFFGIVLLANYKFIFTKRKITTILKAIILAVGLTSFFLFPMLEQLMIQEYNAKLSTTGVFELQVLPSKEILYDLFLSKNESLPARRYSCGLLLIILSLLIFAVKNKNVEYRFYIKIYIISAIFLLCTSKVLPFYKLTVFEVIQFPWRLNLIVSNVFPFVICYALNNIEGNFFKKVTISLACVYLVFNTAVYYQSIAKNSWTIPNNASYSEIFDEQKYMLYSDGYLYNLSELSGAEYLPYAYKFNYKENSNKLLFPDKSVFGKEFHRNGLEFIVHSDYEWDEELIFPLSWYKGYACEEINENGKKIKEIEVSPDEFLRLVSIKIEGGDHIYRVYYKGTIIQNVSTAISIVSAGYLCIKSIKRMKDENY